MRTGPNFGPESIRQGGEATIESYEQQTGWLKSILDKAQLLLAQRQRLLDEDSLASAKRTCGEHRVA